MFFYSSVFGGVQIGLGPGEGGEAFEVDPLGGQTGFLQQIGAQGTVGPLDGHKGQQGASQQNQ